MAQFNFEMSVTDATRMDAPMERGLMRWQRKALEAGVNRLAISDKNKTSKGPRSANSLTPGKGPNTPLSATTPKTPGTLPNRSLNKTPNQKTGGKQSKSENNTPHKNLDRFIPNRSAMDMEVSHRLLNNGENVDPVTGEMSPRTCEYRRRVREAAGGAAAESKILAFKQKAPAAREGHVSNLKVLYSSGARSTTKATSQRHIPQQPEKILDAPDLIDDYYLNPLSWSSHNLLTVALGSAVYLWNSASGTITQLVDIEGEEDYVSSVAWIKEGNFLAVGVSDGSIQLWDVGSEKLMRTMRGHAARVATLAWNSYILSSGCRTGAIHHHDVRVAEHHVGTLLNHTQEVCGLSWSGDGRYLASGGNDNLVNIWDASLGHENAPLHSFTHHQAAVKAVAWCPWQATLLATGGGTADRHIRFWNVATGSCLSSTDTHSQVSALLWSQEYRKLVSGHGYVQNQLTVWKYPAMTCQANLTGHTERILALAMSPDGQYVASAAADESIRLWKVFEPAEKKGKPTASKTVIDNKLSMLTKGIR